MARKMMLKVLIIIIIIIIIIMENTIRCAINCNYIMSATLYILNTWFVSGM
jgi:hypothetical protein